MEVENGDTQNGNHAPGCGLADNIDVRLCRLDHMFNCGAMQACPSV